MKKVMYFGKMKKTIEMNMSCFVECNILSLTSYSCCSNSKSQTRTKVFKGC